jgi:glycosyltransferase involved in cell wall biosynthesis
MRYLWDLYPEYRNEYVTSRFQRALMTPFANYLRLWDFASAARVDEFIANSDNVRKRIWKTYRRDCEVIHPPVDVESFSWKPASDYFLIVSELVPYKRVDIAVKLFARTGRRLVIAGGGPEYRRLKSLAGPATEFAGRVPDNQLRDLYASCRALLLPGEEDFGITAVEALASGKPVVALGRGGVLESVPLEDPCGGVLYDAPDEMHLETALSEFEQIESSVSQSALRHYARRFATSEFQRKMGLALGLSDVRVATVKSAAN